jgi:hypothetical protein
MWCKACGYRVEDKRQEPNPFAVWLDPQRAPEPRDHKPLGEAMYERFLAEKKQRKRRS